MVISYAMCDNDILSAFPSCALQQCMTKFWKSVQTLASSGFVHAGMLVEKTLSEASLQFLLCPNPVGLTVVSGHTTTC